MLYYNLQSSIVMNDNDLIDAGYSPDVPTLATFMIFPLHIEAPVYDTENEGIEPDGSPMPDNDKQGWFVQRMRVYSLVDYAKKNAKEVITSTRWGYETGGITLEDGSMVLTGLDDQNRIASAITGVQAAKTVGTPMTTVDFKGPSGWTTIPVEQLEAIASLVAHHVQACFTREKQLHELIDAAITVEAIRAIKIDAGWPQQIERDEDGYPIRPERPRPPMPEQSTDPLDPVPAA